MMKTGHRTCTAATPASLLPEAITVKPIKARGNRGSKKKSIKGLWDQNIPSDLLQEILSHLGLKANIRASAVCKTWCEAAISVRKPLPWLFYPQKGSDDENYILFDPSRSQKYKKKFPELMGHEFSCSRDGWLLMLPNKSSELVFFFNPFTRKRIYIPERRPNFLSGNHLAFSSAAPTSSSCLVISFNNYNRRKDFVIASRRSGETVWNIHRFKNQLSSGRWAKCVFSNDVFYFLSTCGYLSVFDPSRATWNILPVRPWTCPTFCQIDFGSRVSMMEHEEDIFVLHMRPNNIPAVFKMNRKRMVWEEKREVGGLTIFASSPGSFARAAPSAKERNRMYPSTTRNLYYSLGDEESYRHPTYPTLSKCLAWVDPPHNKTLIYDFILYVFSDDKLLFMRSNVLYDLVANLIRHCSSYTLLET